MMAEDRLKGSIDQIASLLIFENSQESLSQWDSRIASACNGVNDILERIATKYPQFVA
jgi:hypothetical protein